MDRIGHWVSPRSGAPSAPTHLVDGTNQHSIHTHTRIRTLNQGRQRGRHHRPPSCPPHAAGAACPPHALATSHGGRAVLGWYHEGGDQSAGRGGTTEHERRRRCPQPAPPHGPRLRLRRPPRRQLDLLLLHPRCYSSSHGCCGRVESSMYPQSGEAQGRAGVTKHRHHSIENATQARFDAVGLGTGKGSLDSNGRKGHHHHSCGCF